MINFLVAVLPLLAPAAGIEVRVQQITHGPDHHFFGYIGQCRTIPWNASGRYIVALRSKFQDHMPGPDEAADIILLDTHNEYRVRVVEQTRGWNPQQGTMLYWNPASPETQFFFNDRDPATGKVFCVLYDISLGEKGKRVQEFRFEDTPVGNSGVAQHGGKFLALNYGRLARLREVTGYLGAFDWTVDVLHPEDDGVFRVDVPTGKKRLIVSYRQLRDALHADYPHVDHTPLFINHTLWNRDDNRIYFYARGNFNRSPQRIDVPFCVKPDGSSLQRMAQHIGGHPEWEFGRHILGHREGELVIYNTDRNDYVGPLAATFAGEGGDIALSPDGNWLVDGFRNGERNYYAILRRTDGASVKTEGFDQHGWTSGSLRNDPAPCWNRDSTQILFPSITDDAEHSRQLFIIHITSE